MNDLDEFVDEDPLSPARGILLWGPLFSLGLVVSGVATVAGVWWLVSLVTSAIS